MTTDERAAIRARAEAATPGPWRADWKGTNHYEITSQASDNSYSFWVMTDSSARGEDLDFAAHARQDIPDLLAHAEALERRVTELEGMIGAYERCRELWNKGMESTCDDRDRLKQEVRRLQGQVTERG